MHRKLTEVDGMSGRSMENFRKILLTQNAHGRRWKVPRTHRKLMDSPSAIQEVGGRSRRCTESSQKLTEGLLAARKVDRRSHEHMKS